MENVSENYSNDCSYHFVYKRKTNMSSLFLKNKFELWKSKNFNNDSTWRKRRLELSYSKKIVCFAKRNNSKHDGQFYCFNCVYSFITENKLKSHEKVSKSHEKVSKNKDFCGIVMPSEKVNILELN